MNPVGGRGFWGWGRGRGGGRGWRNWFYATGLTGWQRDAMGWPAVVGGVPPAVPYPGPFATAPSRQQQLDALKGQAEYFEDALEGIRKQIKELETQAQKE
jgi:hypothetical protein